MSRSEDPKLFEQRKKDHIRWSLDQQSQVGLSPSEQVRLIHDPLPEVNFKDIKVETASKVLTNSKPLMVSSMTGGHKDSYEINKILMQACSNKNWAFATGSLRKELEQVSAESSDDEWTVLNNEFGKSLDLIGNIGIAQVISHETEDFKKLVSRYGLKGLYVHLNPLQEVIQPEGTTDFSGGVEAIKRLQETLEIPVFLKETGTGFSKSTFEKVKGLNLPAVDVSGFGGTHWGRIEGLRSKEDSMFDKASRVFADWGVTTVESLQAGEKVLEGSLTELWASGGLRSGLDAAICFALGARVCGFAGPMMQAALEGVEAVEELMDQIEYELRIALFCTGTCSINKLNKEKVLEYGT
ncbi:MAG: type 2 isopentenyl-diphosphate Delta-isomerase [Bdellovibrionales bacterium]